MIDSQALVRVILSRMPPYMAVEQGSVMRALLEAICMGVAEAVEAELNGEPLREVATAVLRAEKTP